MVSFVNFWTSAECFCLGYNVLNGEAKLLHEQCAKGGGAEAVDLHAVAFEADVFVPAEAAGGFHYQELAAGSRHPALAVGGIPLFEEIHAGHGYDTHVLAVSAQAEQH